VSAAVVVRGPTPAAAAALLRTGRLAHLRPRLGSLLRPEALVRLLRPRLRPEALVRLLRPLLEVLLRARL
jgi:hypothetical protein